MAAATARLGRLGRLGRLAEIWRYPVKSMAGERLDRCTLASGRGLAGDRAFALRDEDVGEIRGAKHIPELLRCAARGRDASAGELERVEIRLPGGMSVDSDAPDVHEAISRAVGRRVTLWSRRPAEDLEHYRRRERIADEASLRRLLGLLPDEPLPALEADSGAQEFVSPPGTYFDSFELHLLTRASLETLAGSLPDSTVDARRFRPNLVVDTGDADAGFPELDWCGRTLRVGPALVRIDRPMLRCVMTTCEQADLPRDPRIMRALVKHAGQDLGVGASVLRGGILREGDPVELVDGAEAPAPAAR